MNSKVDIFASPKHHSLFPLAIPCQDISTEDYHIFYQHERRLYSLLIVVLHREVVQSILVLGFLLWLEREGYSSKNLVQTIVDSLSLSAIDLVIDEVVICLKCIEKKGKKLVLEGSNTGQDILLLKNLLDRKMICLKELHENRDEILKEVTSVAKHVCGKAFGDILHQYMECCTPSAMVSPAEVITRFVVGGSRYLGPLSPPYDVTNYHGFYRELLLGIHQDRSLLAFGNVNGSFEKFKDLSLNVPPGIGEQEHEVSRDDRTIFLTFSKGYPISENEVRDYFTRYIHVNFTYDFMIYMNLRIERYFIIYVVLS